MSIVCVFSKCKPFAKKYFFAIKRHKSARSTTKTTDICFERFRLFTAQKMLFFRSVLQTNKICFLKVNTGHNRFVSQKLLPMSQQCLSNPNNQSTCLYTQNKSGLLQPSFGGKNFGIRYLTQEPNASKFIPRYEADKISKHYKLVYANSTVGYYQMVQLFLYPMSMVGIIASGNLIWTNYEDFFQSVITMGDHPFVAGCTFFFVSFAMLRIFVNMCQRSLIRIYINPQTGSYVAVRFPWNFLKKKFTFKPSDVKVGQKDSFLPFNRSNLEIKGQPFLIMNRDFVSPNEYNKFSRNTQKIISEELENK